MRHYLLHYLLDYGYNFGILWNKDGKLEKGGHAVSISWEKDF